MVRITPAIPCCDTCVLQAAQRAGFDYTSAFVVVSGLEELAPEGMTQFIGSMVGSTGSKAFLFVETPLAALPEATSEGAEEGDDDSAPAPEGEDSN